MTLIRWKPISELSRWSPVTDVVAEFGAMQKEFDRAFDRFQGGMAASAVVPDLSPSVDIVENDENYTVSLELPGVAKEAVKITVDDGVLTVKGEKKQDLEVKQDRFRRIERNFGSFARSFTLPPTVQTEKIAAAFADGVLTITIPKAEQAKPREIEVKIR